MGRRTEGWWRVFCGWAMWVLGGRIVRGCEGLSGRRCSLGEAGEVRLRGCVATGGACPSPLTQKLCTWTMNQHVRHYHPPVCRLALGFLQIDVLEMCVRK